MKLRSCFSSAGLEFSARRCRGFTLAELMTAMAIFSLVVVAMVSIQIFGMRMYRISETKLAATANGRRALNQIRDDIRTAKILIVGNGTGATFSKIPDNQPQIGNAIQIYPTTNLNNYVRYYLDSSDNSLKRLVSVNNATEVIASYITNQLVFQAEDYRGNVLTNDQNNRVIHMTVEFYQWEYPVASAGNGGMYDYYRLQTRITRRAIE